MAAFGQNNAASVRHRQVADPALRVPGHQVQAVAVTVAVFPAAYDGMNVALAVNPVDAPQASVPAPEIGQRSPFGHAMPVKSVLPLLISSEDLRVGKELFSPCRSRLP